MQQHSPSTLHYPVLADNALGGDGGRMNSSADRVENVVESGIGRLLLREEMMRKRAVGRPQEWRRQAESGQVVAQSAVGDAAPLQFAQFRLVGRRFARRVVDDDVAALLLLLGSEAGQSAVHQLGQRRRQFGFEHFGQTFQFGGHRLLLLRLLSWLGNRLLLLDRLRLLLLALLLLLHQEASSGVQVGGVSLANVAQIPSG